MRFARSIGFDVAQIALMTLRRHRAAMLVLGRVEMRAGRGGIGRGAIALFMDMEAVFARLQTGDVGDDLHVIAHFGECHRAGDLTA